MQRFIIPVLLMLSFYSTAQQHVLHYDEATGFDHQTSNVSLSFFQAMGATNNFVVVQDSDGSEFTDASLATYDLVIFSNTSGDEGLTAAQRAAFEKYIDENGGKMIGIHAASDTYRHSSANGGKTGTWDWYAETLGGSVQTNPNHTSANHVNDITKINNDPATEGISFPWTKEEEYYYWENGYIHPSIIEIMRVGDSGDNSYDDPRPISWKRTKPGGAEIFYTAMGHKTGNFTSDNTNGFADFRVMLENVTLDFLSSVLPVELNDFTGEFDVGRQLVQLSWTTLSESGADYFEIQKSIDGIIWLPWGKTNAVGESTTIQTYESQDRLPNIGKNYYRLKQYDLNGEYQIYEPIVVEVKSNSEITMSPNPAVEQIHLNFGKRINSSNIHVLDISGRIVKIIEVEGTDSIEINLEELLPGIYYLQIEGPDVRQMMKFVKSQ